MNFIQFDNLLKKFGSGTATKEEEAYVLKWFEQVGTDVGTDKKHIVQDDQKFSLQQKAWSAMQQHMDERRSSANDVPDSQPGVLVVIAKVAASILLIVAAVSAIYLGDSIFANSEQLTSSNNSWISVLNTDSIERIVELEDGSKVSLRPESELKYPEHFAKEREVYLVGEAFFDIAHDANHPFLVHAKEVTTKVLGTSFTIRAYPDQEDVSVAVRTGKVIVSAPGKGSKVLSEDDKQEIILTPNQEVTFDSKTEALETQLVERPQIVEVVPSLKMKYSNASVIEIFEKLEQAYGVPIKFDRQMLASCTVTTTFSEEDLYERVSMICYALGGEYKIENLEIQILAKGCK